MTYKGDPATEQELELMHVLQLAEKLSEELRQKRDHQFSRSSALVVYVTAVLSTVPAVIYTVMQSRTSQLLIATVVLSVMVTLFAVVLIRSRRNSRENRQIRNDVRALVELTELLRSLEAKIASENRWSAMKQAEYRIRLSRLDIEDDVRSRKWFM